MKIEIWVEGYRATGQSGKAHVIKVIEAEDFNAACDKLCASAYWGPLMRKTVVAGKTIYSYWGCQLYDNETDARKNFG